MLIRIYNGGEFLSRATINILDHEHKREFRKAILVATLYHLLCFWWSDVLKIISHLCFRIPGYHSS